VEKIMKLTEKQIRFLHAKTWNSPKTSDVLKKSLMADVGFGQSAEISGTGSPLYKRRYQELPTELRDQFVMRRGNLHTYHRKGWLDREITKRIE